MKGSQIGAIVLALVIVGGGAFYGGMQYDKSQQPARPTRSGNFGGAAGQGLGGRGGQNGGGFTTGQVVSKDDKSVTVQMRDGSSKVVFFSTSTTIGKMSSGSPSDLTVGSNVMVTGSTNADGSVAANSIQLRPAMPNGAPGAAPAPANQ
jgi:hypothetical protein